MNQTRREFLEWFGIGLAGVGFMSAVPSRVAAKETYLPRSTPEAQGVSPAGIVNFLQVTERRNFKLHSLMVVRNGHVVAEGWWAPYRADRKHTLYSLSKSITATAVGLAVGERRLTVEDTVVSFFPDDVPANADPKLARMKVKHLLTMSTGHDLTDAEVFPRLFDTPNDNWVRTFLALPIGQEPGSRFRYNTLATYMLGRIVQKLTGQTLIEYLTPRLFEPLGIEGADWEIDTQRFNVGGWGLRLKTEDIAKFGQLYLQYGVWNEKQVVPSVWIDEATQQQIVQPRQPNAPRPPETDDWMQGYGYQLWGCRNGAYRADGAFGQFCIVIPDQNAVVVITAEQADMQAVLDEVWNHLLPAFQRTNQITETTRKAFERAFADLAISPPAGSLSSPTVNRVNRRTYAIGDNPQGVSLVSLDFGTRDWVLDMQDRQGKHQLRGGLFAWREGVTTLSPLPLKLLPTPVPGEVRHPVAVSGAWRDPNTFQITCRYVETAHYDTLTFRFEGDTVQITPRSSLTELTGRPDKRAVLEGISRR
ncbi:serine hydrolase [Rudanella paleaurantiibacter]|uniref:Serine hydrolase n=1 Tax=Rudanella paleaurantiibacter TaxID=2614655 RepID=A0A7J5U629_9BACT|nr:serine hydrolase [Rudanella paleaurantiibacter]KAB7733037.1 serine hydrolase [Rudanella paleaurantiibacter]